MVSEFIDEFGGPDCIVMVDPVMGDEGHPYGTLHTDVRAHGRAHGEGRHHHPEPHRSVHLTGLPFSKDMTCEDAAMIARQLSQTGPARVVVTGVEFQDRVANVCYERTRAPFTIQTARLGGQRSGTGDVFSAILIADAVNGVPLDQSVEKASHFVCTCVERAIDMDLPRTDGLPIEEELRNLRQHRAPRAGRGRAPCSRRTLRRT